MDPVEKTLDKVMDAGSSALEQGMDAGSSALEKSMDAFGSALEWAFGSSSETKKTDEEVECHCHPKKNN